MLKQQIHCLLVGDEQHHEWRSVTEWLTRHVRLVIDETPQAALAAFQTSDVVPSFDLIIMAQSRPGQFASEDVESVYQKWPTAKLLGLFGTWCEGEGRTGRPWPGVWRVHAGNCIRVLRELFDIERPKGVRVYPESGTGRRTLRGGELQTERTVAATPEQAASRRSRSWLLPRSITDAERIYYDAAEPLIHGKGEILISTVTAEAYETLADAVGQSGFSSTWQRAGNNCETLKASAAILDMMRGTTEEWQSVQEWASRIAPAPLVVLLGFPRVSDFALAETLSAGVYGKGDQIVVLPKPFRLNDLGTEITRMTGITGTTRALETPA
jgi:hypothetical protein